MDWGLLRDGKILRNKLFYPKYMYYFTAITNLFLRFSWVVPIIGIRSSIIEYLISHDLLFFILAFAELYRRAQWSIFRVENENIHNYEKYRVIHEIPKMLEDKVSQQVHDDDYF